MKSAIIISNSVPENNKSPIAVNKKILNICYEIFEKINFISAGFPENEFLEFSKKKFHYNDVPMPKSKSQYIYKILAYILFQLRIPKIIKKSIANKQDTLIIFWLSGPMIIPFLYCKLKGYKTLCFLYGNTRYKTNKLIPVNFLISKITKFMAMKASITAVESKSVVDEWDIDFEKSNIKTIHLYIDTDKFYDKISIDSREKIIGMSSRITASKNVLETITAFHNLKEEFPKWKLEIAGTGELYNQMVEKIEILKEKDRISLLGWVENSEMPDVYNRWQATINPTNYEGLPNSLLESMSCGTPTASTLVGGIKDVIEPKINGWEIKENTVEAIERAIQKIIFLKDKSMISMNCRKYILENYSFESAVENFKKIISEEDWDI